MKKDIRTKYMMATKAIHLMGDISRKTPDLCIVSQSDKDNYYGHWVTGFGFVDVAFPRKTTHKLTPKDIEKYHGAIISMGDCLFAINLKKEKFDKRVIVTNKKTKQQRIGTLIAPIKEAIVMIEDNYKTFHTSKIKSIKGNVVKTQNSTYIVKYL